MSHNTNLENTNFEAEIGARSLRKKAAINLPFYDDSSDISLPGIISSQTFQAENICTLKVQNLLHGIKEKVPIAYAAKENRLQGHQFERVLLKYPHLWLAKLCQAVKIADLKNPAIIDCEITMRDKSITYLEKSKKRTKRIITKHLIDQPNTPVIFWKATFGGKNAEQVGRSDFIIYTGESNQWLVANIKRSEECKTTFGIQLFFCRELLAELLADIFNTSTSEIIKEDILPYGAIIHYEKGYTWSSKAPTWDQSTCLRHLLVTSIELGLLERDFQSLFAKLVGYKATGPVQSLCKFTNYCIECQFRANCYQQLIQPNQTDISLVPMDGSILWALKARGVHSAEELGTFTPTDRQLLELLENQARVATLITRARKVAKYKGFSNWIYKTEWEKLAWLFTNHRDGGLETQMWKDPTGKIHEDINEIPEVVVVLCEVNRKEAYLILQKKFGSLSLRNLEFITILDDLHTFVHTPLPSYTPTALAKYFSLIDSGKDPGKIIKAWFEQENGTFKTYKATEMPLLDVTSRMLALTQIWGGLKKLAKILHT